jgi:hypothetical protein
MEEPQVQIPPDAVALTWRRASCEAAQSVPCYDEIFFGPLRPIPPAILTGGTRKLPWGRPSPFVVCRLRSSLT